MRNAVAADVEAVIRLMGDLAAHEGLSEFFTVTAETLTQYCFDSPPRVELLVAADGDEVVGYATLLVQLSPWAGREYLFLDDLYVVPERRGAGVGALLMKHVGEVAKRRRTDVRWHVENDNVAAQRFYESLGAGLRNKFIAYWTP